MYKRFRINILRYHVMRYLRILSVLVGVILICVIQIYQDTSKMVITEDLVTEVEDWPYGIKYARWDNQTEVDWNWLNILENILTPGKKLHSVLLKTPSQG